MSQQLLPPGAAAAPGQDHNNPHAGSDARHNTSSRAVSLRNKYGVASSKGTSVAASSIDEHQLGLQHAASNPSLGQHETCGSNQARDADTAAELFESSEVLQVCQWQ